MWKQIDNYGMITQMHIGDIISSDPRIPDEQYEVKEMHEGLVKAIATGDKIAVTVFPEKDLIVDKWWVKT